MNLIIKNSCLCSLDVMENGNITQYHKQNFETYQQVCNAVMTPSLARFVYFFFRHVEGTLCFRLRVLFSVFNYHSFEASFKLRYFEPSDNEHIFRPIESSSTVITHSISNKSYGVPSSNVRCLPLDLESGFREVQWISCCFGDACCSYRNHVCSIK